MLNETKIVINKLESFIKKYYTNKIIQGLIFLLLFAISAFLLFTILEYYGRFEKTIRTIFFFSYIAGNITILTKYIIIPLLKIFKIGNRLDYISASKIIAQHFPEINDKVTNILELSKLQNDKTISTNLIIASIKHKTQEIKPIPFNIAIKFKENLKYAKYITIPIVTIIFITFYNPVILSEGSSRFVNYNKKFIPKAPYKILLLNKKLKIESGNDFTIKALIKGKEIPERLFVKINGYEYMMKKENKTKFSYTLRHLNNSINFKFTDLEYTSKNYTLKVLPPPVIIDFTINITPPEYTNTKNYTQKNTGDISCPEGSTIEWTFNTKNTSEITLSFSDTTKITQNKNFIFTKKTQKNLSYSINIKNENFTKTNLLQYKIEIIKDLNPEIKLKIIQDSTTNGLYYFSGFISDDYGFHKLTFNYNETGSNKTNKVEIPINKNIPAQEFFFAFDFNTIQNTKNIEYFFEISDHDKPHNFKKTKTTKYTFHKLTDEEITKIENEKSENINTKITDSKQLLKELQEDIKNLQKDLINNKNSEWENRKKLQEILQKQKELEKKLKDAAKENKEKNKLTNNDEKKKKLAEKQKQIQDLLDKVMDDELKKLLDELQKLLQQFDEKKFNELSKKYEMSLDDMEKRLDQNLEQLKQYEVEKRLEKTIDDLNKLAEKQKKLAQKTNNKNNNNQELKQQQETLNKKFNEITKEFEQTLKKNEELEKPMRIDDFDQEQQNIKQEMTNSKQKLDQNKRNKASKSQQKASQQIKQMAQQLKQMMQEATAAQQTENMDNLRKIIDNLEIFSLNQEKTMQNLKKTNRNDPKIVEITEKQGQLIKDFQIIKDSLYALAKRVPQLNSPINKQILNIESQNEYIIEDFQDNKLSQAKIRQQSIMTSANELALLLDEILKQMQQNQKKKPGNQQCQNPGQGMPSMSQLRKQQESLKKQLEGMINDLKGKPKKPGQNQQLNKQLAKMLAQQEMFQKQLSELMQNNSISPKQTKQLNEINQLIEQMKRDIVNKNISPQMLNRQNKIITRLLEAENAQRERDIDKKRQSEEGKNKQKRNITNFNQYKENMQGTDEILIFKNLKLNKYYKQKYNEYLMILNQEK